MSLFGPRLPWTPRSGRSQDRHSGSLSTVLPPCVPDTLHRSPWTLPNAHASIESPKPQRRVKAQKPLRSPAVMTPCSFKHVGRGDLYFSSSFQDPHRWGQLLLILGAVRLDVQELSPAARRRNPGEGGGRPVISEGFFSSASGERRHCGSQINSALLHAAAGETASWKTSLPSPQTAS